MESRICKKNKQFFNEISHPVYDEVACDFTEGKLLILLFISASYDACLKWRVNEKEERILL